MSQFKPGDLVEVAHTTEWQNKHRDADHVKAVKEAHKRGRRCRDVFIGNAAAYMHPFCSYTVVEITETGGLRLEGFVPQVSPNDVRLATGW